MSFRFKGSDIFQRGRGIGGLFRIAKGLFKPLMGTIGRALKSNTGRAIGRALKDQAITTGTNLLADAENDKKQRLKRELQDIRQRSASGIQQLKNRHRGYESDEDESEIEYEQNPRIKKKQIKSKKKNQVKKRGSKKFKFLENE